MKYLLSGIHAHYKFNPTVRSGNVNNIVVINSLGKHPYDHESAPLDKYSSLKEVLETFKDLTTFFEYLLAFQKPRMFLSLEVEDNHKLAVGFLRTLYPNMTNELIQIIVQTWVRCEKIQITSNSRWPEDLRQAYSELKAPTLAQVRRYDMLFTGHPRLSEDLRRRVGIEYLLAHAYAVDFEDTDVYVLECALRIEKLIWGTVIHDFLRLRKRALLGQYRLGGIFNLPIEPERYDLDTHLRRVTRSAIFGNIDADVVGEFLLDNFNSCFDFILKMQRTIGEDTSYTEERRQLLDPKIRITPAQAKACIEDGPSMAWSKLLNHPGCENFVNPSMLDLIQLTDREGLQTFRLDTPTS